MTKNLKYILIVFSVIFCLAGLVGFQTSVNSRAYADGEPYIEFATYVDGKTSDTRVIDTQSQIANTPVVITYKITHNDGINSILLVPSYNDEVFEIASVITNDATSYNIVVDETTVLGEATITEYDTTPVKILLESTGTEQVSKFSAVSGENEVFLTITYNIINVVGGNYGFGLVLKTDLETPVENGASEAYFIEDGQQKGEQTEVDIRMAQTATLTIVTMKDAQIIIGSNDTVEEAAAYTFVYNGSVVTTTKVVDAFSVTPTGVEYRYTDTTYNDLSFGENIEPTIRWYAYDSYYENNLGEQLNYTPSAPGVYMVGISAPTNGIYRSVAETYRLVQIIKRTISITIDNKSSAYGAPIVALTSDASADLATSLSLVLSTTATSSSDVGNYPITATYTSSPFYNVNITNGTYTITKKAITITALDQTATYTGSEPTVDQSKYTVTGVDSISGVVITKAQGVNVGEYTLTPSLNNNNYEVTPVTGKFTITSVGKNADFVKSFFSGRTVVYNAQNQNLLVVSNEKPDWIGFSAESSKKDVNTYQITVNILVSAQDAKNYMDASLVGDQNFVATVNGEITPAALEITADNNGHVYGNAPATLTPAQVNGLGSDVINVTFTVKNGNDVITLANNTPVGAYTIVPSATNSNYNITAVNGTYTVTKATAQDIAINATANNINYNRPYDYTVSSVKVNTLSLESYTVTIQDANGNPVTGEVPNAGSYKVVITVPGTDNYEGTTLEVPFTINKISLKTPTVVYNKDTATWTVVTTDSGDKALNNATVSYAINNNAVEGNSYTANSTDALTLTVSSSNDNYLPVNVTLENVYSVTFSEGTHTASSATAQNMPGAQYVFKGQQATVPTEVPTLAGYAFNAWDFDFATAINANTTVVALWNINTLTMTVIYVEKTNKTEKTLTFTVDYNAEVAISDYNLKLQTGVTGDNDDFAMEYDLEGLHYKHIGLWNYKVTGSEEWIETEVHQIPVNATSDLTFVAVYTSTPIEYVLTYMLSVDGGEYSAYGEAVDVAFGTTIEYNALTAVRWFKADAWFTNEGRTTVAPATMPAGDLIVYGAIVFDIGTGDVNGDGNVNADDITLYRQWIVGGYEMNVVTVGGEYTTVTANNFDANARYFIAKVADNNNDTSRDIRDVSITRMAIVGGYTWDKENGYNVTGNEIIRNVNTDALNTINGAITAGKKVTLTGNVTVADGEVNINTTKNVNINLGGNTLTVSKFNVVSNNRVTITVTNGTIVATNGITISAPNGNVVLTNLTGYDANGEVNLAAANHSLHFNGNVKFYEGTDTTVAEPTPAAVKVEKGTHVVVEPAASVVVEKLVVTENFVATQATDAVITLDNFSAVTEEIIVEGNATTNNEITTLDELREAVSVGGSYKLMDDFSFSGSNNRIIVTKDTAIDLNGHSVTSTNEIPFVVVNGATLTIKGNGNVNGREACVMAFGGSSIVINGGIYTCTDNFIFGTNGNAGNGNNNITINAGTFNGGIISNGYVACGIYVANSDTVVVNGGTFNITNGVGILARAGQTTVGANVVFNVTGNGTFGKVGDSKVTVPAGAELVIDYVANYPGLNDGFSFVNNSQYKVTANASTEANLLNAMANADSVKLATNIAVTAQVCVEKDLILDLNGYTITGRLSVFNGNVTINNGKVVGEVDAYDGAVLTLGADLTVENNDDGGFAVVVWGEESSNLNPQLHVYGNVSAKNTNAVAISGNGTDLSNATCVIYSGANVSSAKDIAIYWPNDGTLNVKAGATVTGATAIYIKSGTVSIENNANITSNLSEKRVYAYNGNGANATGDAIVIDNCYYPGGNANVTISGTYDVGTYWYVKTEQQLRSALAFGGNIKLGNNITVTGTTANDRLAITVDTNLDLNGKTIKSVDGLEPTSNWSTLWVNNGAVANISNGTIGSCYDTNDADAPYGITVGLANGTAGTVNLTNVNVYGGTSAVYVILGEANIYSGTFEVAPYIDNDVENYEFLLNCLDDNYNAGTAVINVYGGSFENFNPANCKAEGEGTNFVANGYTVNSIGAVYTVTQE